MSWKQIISKPHINWSKLRFRGRFANSDDHRRGAAHSHGELAGV
jgi:hypothetical protein